MIKQRIILLPGFSEDAYIFDEIKSSFSDYELVFVDYRNALEKHSLSTIDVWKFSKSLIEQYKITATDKLIGHSMGGYFSFVIRELISAEISMIASFSDPNKVRRITQNRFITIFIAKTGIIKTDFFQKFLKKPTKGKYYESVHDKVMQNMKTFSSSQLAKMVKMSFGEKVKSKFKNPLRIHAKNDSIVRAPDEEYVEVKLGHFCLILEPKEVLTPILNWLNKNKE